MRLHREREATVAEFHAQLVPGGPRPTVVVRGEVDRTTTAGFQAVLDAAVRRSSRLALDLRDMTFMDTAGLKVLVDLQAHLGGRTDAIVLHHPPLWFRRLLRLVGVEALFTLSTGASSEEPA